MKTKDNMFKEIKLTKDLTIYTSKITNIDNSMLVKDFEYNCDISKQTTHTKYSPGIQSRIYIISKNIANLKNEVLKKIISHFKLNKNYLISYDDWVYISESTNDNTYYHDHIHDGNLIFTKEPPQWSLVYYAQMPNNLQGKDGQLTFKTKNDEEVSVLPEENQIIMFPSDVLHKPELNKNSTTKRIVLATNITILDRNKKYIKETKTLL
jgi:hypothetical protein